MDEVKPRRLDILVRSLTVDDWEQARTARLAALADAPYAFASTLGKEQAYDDDHWRRRAGSGRTFGAFDGMTLIGIATGIPTEELDPPVGGDRYSRARSDWQLVGMWVAPDYRGQGVADRLVEAVCERARQADADTVTLWVTEINHRASALYRRHGFAPTGLRQLVWPEQADHWEQQLALRLR
jgi:ribosomal protein S18 acetylase RimI-like enzyme